MPNERSQWNSTVVPVSDGLSRRRFLELGAGAAGALGAGSLLAACGGGGNSTSNSSKPVRGGTLTAGMISGGKSETIVPGLTFANADLMRVNALYDPLVRLGPDLKMEPWLATSWEPSADAMTWTFKLRKGVEWHDGKPFTADDVVWTVRSWGQPQFGTAFFYAGELIDFDRVRKVDTHTVAVPLQSPIAQFPTLLNIAFAALVIPDGATPEQLSKHPNGTGPFVYQSFTAGKQSVFTRNPNYWQHGKPYLDKLVVDSSFTEETARLNALQSGQINALPIMPFLAGSQATAGSFTVQESPKGAVSFFFGMRVDEGPFADPRVRQAMKLLTDRQALIDGALAGFGTPGNDVLAPGVEYSDDSLVSTYDVEQAKSLLKAAGQEGLRATLVTSPAFSGFVESATLLAQQAKAAGVTIDVKEIPASTYYTPAGGYEVRPFSAENTGNANPSMTAAALASMMPGRQGNIAHWGDQKQGGAAKTALILEAMKTLDPAKAERLWGTVQEQQFDEGGYLVWGNAKNLDAVANNVHGLYTTTALNCYQNSLADAWVE